MPRVNANVHVGGRWYGPSHESSDVPEEFAGSLPESIVVADAPVEAKTEPDPPRRRAARGGN